VPSYGGVLELGRKQTNKQLTIKKCKRTSRKITPSCHGLCMIFHVLIKLREGGLGKKKEQTKFGFIDDKGQQTRI
jgi:hypothetical protein